MSWAYIKCLKVLLLDVSGETNDAMCVLWLPFLTLYWFNKDRPLPLHYYTHRFAESASLRCTDYWWELHYPGYGCVCECARICGYVCSCVNTSMVIVSGNLIVLQNEQIISCRIVTKGIGLRWVVQWVFGDCAWPWLGWWKTGLCSCLGNESIWITIGACVKYQKVVVATVNFILYILFLKCDDF